MKISTNPNTASDPSEETYIARTAPFIPGASPPDVRTPILFLLPDKACGGSSAILREWKGL
jgi:hypothetical protein